MSLYEVPDVKLREIKRKRDIQTMRKLRYIQRMRKKSHLFIGMNDVSDILCGKVVESDKETERQTEKGGE